MTGEDPAPPMAETTGDSLPPATQGLDHSAKFLAPVSLLYAVSLVFTTARICSRTKSRLGLRWNDYTLVLGMVVGSAWFVIVAYLYGRGRGVEGYPTDLAAIGPLLVVAGFLWIWTTNLIRVSMGLMLLCLQVERRWTWPLRIHIIVQICLMIAATMVQLLLCRPLSSLWNPTPDMECIPKSGMVTYGIIYNVFNIASDFTLALMPLNFIPAMHRTIAEKTVLYFLLAAGLGATSAAMVRAITLLGFYGDDPVAWLNVKTDLLSGVEMFLGAIAASLPCLRGPTHRLLIQIGLIGSSEASDASSGSYLYRLSHGKHFRHQLFQLENPTRVQLPQHVGV